MKVMVAALSDGMLCCSERTGLGYLSLRTFRYLICPFCFGLLLERIWVLLKRMRARYRGVVGSDIMK
jgi:hypothetical protein